MKHNPELLIDYMKQEYHMDEETSGKQFNRLLAVFQSSSEFGEIEHAWLYA